LILFNSGRWPSALHQSPTEKSLFTTPFILQEDPSGIHIKSIKMRSFATIMAAAALAQTAMAHYRFNQLIVGSEVTKEYEYVRQNSNMNSPVTDVTSKDLICNAGGLDTGAQTLVTLLASLSTLLSSTLALSKSTCPRLMAMLLSTMEVVPGLRCLRWVSGKQYRSMSKDHANRVFRCQQGW
jgi:hypothetical protein